MNLQNIEDELNYQKRNLELLNYLESKCEGLENLLCKNVMNIISKKIDSIENKFNKENSKRRDNLKSFPSHAKETSNADKEKIEKLNNNLDIIKNNFENIFTTPDSKSSEIIGKKIEENYKLLDELERTNRPIFTKSTEINNRFFIEDKIKEMDSKVSVLCSTKNPKNITESINKDNINRTRLNDIEAKLNTYTPFYLSTNFAENRLSPISKKNDEEIERKKKELYSKLNFTEKKIKEIAGNILKNF